MEDRDTLNLTLVIIGIVFILVLFRACSGAKVPVQDKPFTPRVSVPLPDKKPTSKPRPMATSSLGSPATQRAISDAKEVIAKLREVNDKAGTAWLQKMLSDPSVATLTREIYRLRNIPAMANGYALINQGDFSEARDQFIKGFEDPESTPAVRYVACQYLMNIAKTMKDPDGYFKWGIEMGKLLEKEDLSCIEQERSKAFLKRMTEKEILFKARNDTGMQDKLVDFYFSQLKSNMQLDELREQIRKQMLEDIKRVEKEVLG